MKRHLIRVCKSCSIYTLKPNCPECGSVTTNPHPPRYSPDDKYIRYRIQDRYSNL
ncbi:MAG TPA: RNA-protein complex protein Nop10 [Nitrososphaeraceae archaeon]|nr:RNA-protein complex protein Nop10 [Nitrososphaeraceae archaeon]